MIRALIVDDEALAREGIRALLSEEPAVSIAGEAADGPQAVKAIRTLMPDLVFLDIHMPGFDGFQVLRRTARNHLPAVIFVTAHDEYACQAFDARAVDYLLKPITRDRFRKAMERMRRELMQEEALAQAQKRLAEFLDAWGHTAAPHADRRYQPWFTVRDGHSYRVVRTDEVSWIASALNYVELHVKGRTHLLRITMNELEDRLEPACFVRIHRSAIVNVSFVEAIDQTVNGELAVRLKDGTTLPMGRGYRHRLLP